MTPKWSASVIHVHIWLPKFYHQAQCTITNFAFQYSHVDNHSGRSALDVHLRAYNVCVGCTFGGAEIGCGDGGGDGDGDGVGNGDGDGVGNGDGDGGGEDC